jgi:ribonuclease P protein component
LAYGGEKTVASGPSLAGPVDRSKDSSDQRLRPVQRVRDTKDFQRVYAGRQKVNTSNVIVCYSPNGLPHSRLGVSVGVKHGNAVQRNRIKRVFRAAFRQGRAHLPSGFDYVLIPQSGAREYSTAAMLASLTEAGKRVQARLKEDARRAQTGSGR